MDGRRFNRLSIPAVGVQRLEARFGKRRRYEDVPAIAQWRCNLTGLSQTHNLYFVAYIDYIHVFQPSFPAQSLSERPALILQYSPSSEGLSGHMPQAHPHAINNLIVECLGSEEVIATVRDDGDVDVVLVRHVVQAIQRRQESGNHMSLLADDVRPIFQSNVGRSAWGIAIHSLSRILAVSANTHNITVFKFGLVSDDGHDAVTAGEHHQSSHHREKDVTQQVLNGHANIPHIAFCNTGDDPEGRWLLTTDISGFCRSIDLHSMQTVQTFRFGRPLSALSTHSHDRFNSGWTMMFLDPRSFILEDDFQDALGLTDGETLPGVKDNKAIWDIGTSVEHVPDCCSKFTGRKKRKRPRTEGSTRERTAIEVLDPAIDLDEALSTSDDGGGVALEAEAVQLLDEVVNVDDLIPDSDAMEDSDEDTDSGESSYHAEMDIDDEGTEDTVSFSAMYGGRRIFGNSPRVFARGQFCGDLPCPVLHASVRNCYLLQPSDQGDCECPITPPTIGFTNALHQLIHEDYSWLNLFERLNMSAYIPSMGVVVLASQKGRAVVLSLTRLRSSARYPPGLEDLRSIGAKTKYAMRIERVLPYATQEEAMQRPFAPLVGLSTGPMQGTEHCPDDKKRWRLLLMYADHAVLSYEISRPHTRDSGVALSDVMV